MNACENYRCLAGDLEPVRLEVVVPRVALAQRQPRCDKHAGRFLKAFDASHGRSSRLGLRGHGSRV
jgi:hypothetical protein